MNAECCTSCYVINAAYICMYERGGGEEIRRRTFKCYNLWSIWAAAIFTLCSGSEKLYNLMLLCSMKNSLFFIIEHVYRRCWITFSTNILIFFIKYSLKLIAHNVKSTQTVCIHGNIAALKWTQLLVMQ